MSTYENYIEELKITLNSNDERRYVAQQLLYMHCKAKNKVNPFILELGVDTGQSTKVFLNAINKKENSKLVSIDIKDCSNVSDSKKWKFIQHDSSDINKILKIEPEILKGIDILYIDSLHTAQHVKKELYNFFEYLKKDSLIFFDDIESDPYMKNQRKDSAGIEIANRNIFKLLEAVFRSNHNKLDFKIIKGSTGLAIFNKRTNIGDKLNPPLYIKERNNRYIAKLKSLFN